MTGPNFFKAHEIIEVLLEAAEDLSPQSDEADAKLIEIYTDTAADLQELVDEYKRTHGLL